MGLLLNVDYGDFLARARGREVLRRAGARLVELEEAVDAYYVHYRRPIFGGRASELWKRFVMWYVASKYYEAVAPLCRLNHRASVEAAVRLVKAFESYLSALDEGGRAWWGRGRQEAWVKAMSHLRRRFGDPADVDELYRVFKKLGQILGRGRRGDPAALALTVASDPRRLRLARVLAKAVALAGRLAGVAEGDSAVGVGEVEQLHGSFHKVKHAAAGAKALFLGALPLFLYKAATSTLPIRRRLSSEARRVYLLVDKSGSMYSAVGGVEKIALATAYALAMLQKAKSAVLRLFDAEVHKVDDLESLVDVLTRVAAGGGTDLTKAVDYASEEAARGGLRGYSLVVVTDGEDDRFNPKAAAEAKKVFKDVFFVVVGNKPLQGVRYKLLLPGVYGLGVDFVKSAAGAV
ncbi:MAG: VWA domain-containing protein [Pyrobaculum sp.]